MSLFGDDLMFNSYEENTLQYHKDRCINCKRCTEVCPHGVFVEGDKHIKLVQPARCMECGACVLNCPVQAIEVQSGVGCAWAMISAALRGKDMDSGECSCGGDAGSCCGEKNEKIFCDSER
jgi:ferredoxin